MMIVSCLNCNSKYSVDDSKVKGKRFGFDCPKCGTSVEIDNREKRKEEKLFEQINEKEQNKTAQNILEEDDSGLPLDEELDGALENLEEEAGEESSDSEASINLEDMGLSDLENLGEISEAGETAEDAINILPSKDEDGDLNLSLDEKETEKFDDSIFDELEAEGTDEFKADNIFDDFSPIEEDISVEEASAGNEIVSDNNLMTDMKGDAIFSHESKSTDEDEDITIDLDSLDIQLEEEDEISGKAGGASEGRKVEEISGLFEPSKTEGIEIIDLENDTIQKESPRKENKDNAKKMYEDDENITLDLDALDLTLDEVEELKEGEAIDLEDERISLSDAGLTPDELIKEEREITPAENEDEDIRLNIEEVAPEVKTNKFIDEEELPEIDLDRFEEEDNTYSRDEYHDGYRDGYEETEDIRSRKDFKDHEAEIASPDGDIRDTVPGGIVSFSIDYSLRFSRLGAFFRLICLYPIVLIPHFIVLVIYSVLSSILSLLNWVIIAITGVHEEDFTEIQENTIRYLLSLNACCMDVVEERPRFAGKKDIDYPLQFNATYPISYSRILSILRITVVGILLAALPHIILFIILSIGSALICILGIFSIIIRKKWPNILFDFMTRYYRYAANILSYITGVVDRYPSFKFE